MSTMVIQHNLMAMNANRMFGLNKTAKAKSMEKLSSGYKINRAADDAAGLAISEKMRRYIRGLRQGEDNIQDGISWVQIGDGAMEEVQTMVQRMNELAVKAANGTNSDSDREAINREVKYLKREIDHIAYNTKFNEQYIFDISGRVDASLEIEGLAADLKIFDATYDAGNVTYGGFVYGGQRISWDAVDPDMVTVDGSGRQVFKEGTYSYGGLTVQCEDGAEVPRLSRELTVDTSSDGFTIGGESFRWGDLIDEDGKAMSAQNVHSGIWTTDYFGATLKFNIFEEVNSLDAVKTALDTLSTGNAWTEHYGGSRAEQAVDAQNLGVTALTPSQAADLKGNQPLQYTVRAGDGTGGTQDGVWLEDQGGNMVNGSYRSWADLGIGSWDSGSDIQATLIYTYSDTDGTNDTNVRFDFTVSDITGKDSVIDGLNGMELRGAGTETHYTLTGNATAGNSNIRSVTVTGKGGLTFAEEYDMGRDYARQTQTGVATGTAGVTGNTAKVELAGNGASVTLSGSTATAANRMRSDLNSYVNALIRAKTELALAGIDPATVTLSDQDLKNVVGADKVTNEKYLSGTVTFDPSMEHTKSGGANGQTYACATIDFSGLGTGFTLDSLSGSGFDSTCMTCTNHYSIWFTDGVTYNNTTASGYRFAIAQDGQNYTLKIDINSLRGSVNTGEDLAKAIVEIAKTKDTAFGKSYDFHYTQYAADSAGKLYVYDDRPNYVGTDRVKSADFDTRPYGLKDVGNYSITMSGSNGKSATVDYEYYYGDIEKCVEVKWVQDNDNGAYVYDTAKSAYVRYDANVHTDPVDRYNLVTNYYTDQTKTTATTRDALITGYRDAAITSMVGSTELSYDATDYTYTLFSGEERPNIAIRPLFQSDVLEKGAPMTGVQEIRIQMSGEATDAVFIPKFALDTRVMGLYSGSAATMEKALELIDLTTNANHYVSTKRSLYGAYQNRLEHSRNQNANTRENTTAAESAIRDTNMAKEAMQNAKLNILEQAGISVLTQANQSKQGILALLS